MRWLVELLDLVRDYVTYRYTPRVAKIVSVVVLLTTKIKCIVHIISNRITYGVVFVSLNSLSPAWYKIEPSREKFESRKVPFTIDRVWKLLGLTHNKRNYQAVEKALQQLVGVTIYSEGAFFDKDVASTHHFSVIRCSQQLNATPGRLA